MRLATQPTRKQFAALGSEPRLSAFGEGLKRPPSQKELANIFQVTARHLRRWERAEAAAGSPCSRPFTHSDLWRLYQRRGKKGWNREIATRLGLVSIFERFNEVRYGNGHGEPGDERSIVAALMLRSIAEGEVGNGSNQMPHMFGTGIVTAAKAQLRLIVDCVQARDILVKAFFEAALIAEATYVSHEVEAGSPTILSA